MKPSVKFGEDFRCFSKQSQQPDVSKGWITMSNHLQTQTMKVFQKNLYLEILYWKNCECQTSKFPNIDGNDTLMLGHSPFVAPTEAEDQTYMSFQAPLILKRKMLYLIPHGKL